MWNNYPSYESSTKISRKYSRMIFLSYILNYKKRKKYNNTVLIFLEKQVTRLISLWITNTKKIKINDKPRTGRAEQIKENSWNSVPETNKAQLISDNVPVLPLNLAKSVVNLQLANPILPYRMVWYMHSKFLREDRILGPSYTQTWVFPLRLPIFMSIDRDKCPAERFENAKRLSLQLVRRD